MVKAVHAFLATTDKARKTYTMVRRITSETRGMTLIEVMIVMAIVGLAAGMAGVYISSGDTQLRTTLRNLQFDLEQAKQEAVTRNTDVTVDFPEDLPALDCNGDGSINEKDICYVMYEDRDGVPGFSVNQDRELKRGPIDQSIQLPQSQRLSFSPVGSSDPATIQITTAVRNENCQSSCLGSSYVLTINHVGRIHVGGKQEGCVDCANCDACP